MHKYITEVIGTFFLVLTIGLTAGAGGDAAKFAPLAIGCALMVMVYMGGHISGAHYNPAVTLAILIRGKISPADVVPYMIAQILGAVAAAWTASFIMGKTFPVAPGANISTAAALTVEILFTFALALVVLNVATSKKTEGNSYYGLAIGFTIVAAAFAGGPISGGAFNPAVGIGPTVVHALQGGGTWAHLWLYIVGPCIGAIAAAVIFKMQESMNK